MTTGISGISGLRVPRRASATPATWASATDAGSRSRWWRRSHRTAGP